MSIRPILRDDNGLALPNYGSELITKRYSGVTTSGRAITFDVDVKNVIVHLEGTTAKARFSGTAAGSEEIVWTSDGLTLPEVRVVKEAQAPIMTVAAHSGTINVSVMAWR
jgi:hypothetical protein